MVISNLRVDAYCVNALLRIIRYDIDIIGKAITLENNRKTGINSHVVTVDAKLLFKKIKPPG
jgi:hypothetical protein